MNAGTRLHNRLLWCIPVLIGWAFALLIPVAPRVSAQDQAAASIAAEVVAQEDLDGDGQLDRTILATSFVTDRDRVLVYDGGGNMRPGTDWRSATDMYDDTWIFDRAGDGSSQLVLRFTPEDSGIRAILYVDQDGDGQVAIAEANGRITITEPGHAPLSASVRGSWYLPDGRLNWNVRFLSDGPIQHLHTYYLTEYWDRSYTKNDGVPDVELQFADQNDDGIPEYGIWRLLTATPASEGSMRTWIWSNEQLIAPLQPAEMVFWPYLTERLPGAMLAEGRAVPGEQRYFERAPLISFSFNAARIRQIAFEGYPIEHGFHVHSLNAFRIETINYANFENMQAYYDLAGDADRNPELHIRHRYFEAYDILNHRLSTVTNEIRWSWEQFDGGDLVWDYKIGLAGRYEIDSVITTGGYRYRSVPFDELPAWVLNRPWDFATFVAREDADFQSTEGIYQWGGIEMEVNGRSDTLSHYLAGDATVAPEQAFQQIEPGWRGEFVPDLRDSPRLYFSPIDRRLHLHKAAYGIWQLDETALLRAADSDRDGYLDRWIYETDAGVKREILLAADSLVYSDADRVILKAAAVPPFVFETPPPVTSDERARLTKLLETYGATIDPHHPLTMLEQFPGETVVFPQATLRDYRPLEAGFRFVLTVRPSTIVGGDGDRTPFMRLSPGDYVVSYDGQFSVTPLTPSAPNVTVQAHQARLYEATSLVVELSNDGMEDISSASLEILATAPTGATDVIITQTTSLPALEPIQLRVGWDPPMAGAWTVEARLVLENGKTLTFPSSVVTVAPAPDVQTHAILSVSSSPLLVRLVAFGLGLAVVMSAFVAIQQRKSSSSGGEQ